MNTANRPSIPKAKLPTVGNGFKPKLPTPTKAVAPIKAVAPHKKGPVMTVPKLQAAPAVRPAPAAKAAQRVSAPKLEDMSAAQLPGMGNRFVAVKASVNIPSNARSSRKIVERNAQHGGAMANAAKASVILFDPVHLDELRNIKSNLTTYLNEIGLKTADGHWIVHASKSKTLIEMGVAAEEAYRDSAAKFVANYESYCQKWAGNLGDDYDAKLYPAVEKVAAHMGITIGQTGNTVNRKKGFSFSMNMVSEHDDSLEHDMGLTLTDDEREFVAQSARAHYQGVVDQAFAQLQEAMTKIVEGDQPGRRVRAGTVEAANAVARKIEDMGIDHNGVAARAREITETAAPDRKPTKTKKGEPIENANAARADYMSRAAAVLADLEGLNEE